MSDQAKHATVLVNCSSPARLLATVSEQTLGHHPGLLAAHEQVEPLPHLPGRWPQLLSKHVATNQAWLPLNNTSSVCTCQAAGHGQRVDVAGASEHTPLPAQPGQLQRTNQVSCQSITCRTAALL